MTFETLEKIRLYIYGTTRTSRIAAQNCKSNGYRELALQHLNEAELGDQILRELSQEYGDIDAKRKTDN